MLWKELMLWVFENRWWGVYQYLGRQGRGVLGVRKNLHDGEWHGVYSSPKYHRR